MALSVSSKAANIVQSEIRSMFIECQRLGGINLSQGICDLDVPSQVIAGAKSAMDEGLNSYTRFDGIGELRTALAKKILEYNQIQADPESEIIVTSGSTGALFCACLALLDPLDEVILFEPYYGYHLNTLLAVEAKPVFHALEFPDWNLNKSDFEKLITPKTKAILINTPANPSGKVFHEDELRYLADLSVKYDLFVLTDEIYEYLVYGGRKHISIGSFPGMNSRTITVSGFSKSYSITGWRIGYAVAAAKWAQMIGFVSDLVYVCAPAPLQKGVAQGIMELGSGYYASLRDQLELKRDLLCQALMDAGMKPSVPEGAYYVLADITHLPGNSSKEKAMWILQTYGVAGVPDDAFFRAPGPRNLIRFCFAKGDVELEEACRRLKRIGRS